MDYLSDSEDIIRRIMAIKPNYDYEDLAARSHEQLYSILKRLEAEQSKAREAMPTPTDYAAEARQNRELTIGNGDFDTDVTEIREEFLTREELAEMYGIEGLLPRDAAKKITVLDEEDTLDGPEAGETFKLKRR